MQASFNGTSSASTTSYGATGAVTQFGSFISNDIYAYMGMETIQNEHSTFPLLTVSGAGVASVVPAAMSSSQQNLNIFSIHSCAPATHRWVRHYKPDRCEPPLANRQVWEDWDWAGAAVQRRHRIHHLGPWDHRELAGPATAANPGGCHGARGAYDS